LAADLWHLNTLKLGDVLAFLLGEGATLPLGDVRALTSWNIAALLLLNSLALPLLHIIALLLGNVLAVLGDDITALLGVVNLLTHSLGHRAALLGIDSLALAAWNIPAFLLWNPRALPLIDDTAILGGNILTNFLLDSIAFTLGDNFTLGLSSSGAFFLHHRFTFVFKPGCANLIILDGALLFMLGLSGSPWDIDALELRNIVAFFILNSATLGAGILGSLAFASELGVTFLARNSLLDGSLSDLTLTLLDISTNSIGNRATLLPCDSLECGLGDLTANFLGNLATILLRA